MGVLSAMVTGLFAGDASSSTFNRPSAWLVNALSGSAQTASGVRVSPEKAEQIAAVFASIRNISEDLAKIPLKVYERSDRGKIENNTTSAARVIANPNPDMTAFSFRESITALAVGTGNGLAEIVRDGSDRPRQLELIHTSRVKPMRTDDGLIYRVRVNDLDMIGLTGSPGDYIDIPARDMIHVRGHGNDIWGKSPIRVGAESMGITLAAQNQAANFFSKGMSPSGVFVHPENLNETARTNLREFLRKEYGGSENAGKQMVLWGGITYKQISVNPEDAQLLETRLFQIQEIARWFRMPLSKLQENTHATYSNSEQDSLAYIVDTLHAWAVRIEQEFQRKLFLPSDTKHFCKHKLQALVRGDMKTRGEFYKTLFNTGSITPDEIRSLEEMNTLGTEAAEATYLQSGMTTIEHIFEGNNLKNSVSRGTSEESQEPEESTPDDEPADDEGSEDMEPSSGVPQGLRPAVAGLVERCITRQQRACAKKDNKQAARFFLSEKQIMRQALGPVVDDIHSDAEQVLRLIDVYCEESARKGEPALSINELTDKLLGALYE